MWLKSALQYNYGIIREGHSGHVDKTIDELLNRIILLDCADYYKRKINCGCYAPIKASMNIDFDNNSVHVKILMKYYTHKSSNIRKLYDILSVKKEYHTDLNDMFYDVTAWYIDETAIGISFKYNKDEILK
jgi:hypothetical protein